MGKINNRKEVMNLYVLSYSEIQRQFHVETLEEYMLHNKQQLFKTKKSDYSMIGISERYEGLNLLAKEIRKKFSGIG